MTASVIAQQEAQGARFEAIAAAERAISQAFAARAELVDEARRFSAANAATLATTAICAVTGVGADS